MQMSWFNDGKVRYAIEGEKPHFLHIHVDYADTKDGKNDQLIELPGWSFFLANLKSLVLGGPDLRDNTGNNDWDKGFID